MWRGKLIPNRVENYYTSSANSAVFTLYAGVERYCASRMRVFPNAYIIGVWQPSSSQAKKDWYSKISFFSRVTNVQSCPVTFICTSYGQKVFFSVWVHILISYLEI